MNIVPLGGNLWGGKGDPEGEVNLPADYRFKNTLSGEVFVKTSGAGIKTGWTSLQGKSGAKGDKGDSALAPAPSPGAGTAFEHTQAAGSAEWIINHNLGYFPLVAITDDVGNEVESEIFHASINQTSARFSSLRSGKARCI